MSTSLAASTRLNSAARLAAQHSPLGLGRAPLDPRDPRDAATRAASTTCNLRFATNPQARNLAASVVASSAPLAYPYTLPSRAHTRDPVDVVQAATGRFEAAGNAHRAREASMCKGRNPPRLPKNDAGLYPQPNIPYTGFGAAKSEEMRLASSEINDRFAAVNPPALVNVAVQNTISAHRAAASIPMAKPSLGARVANKLGMSQRR